ncbi:MAG TPA: hypothetical protein VN648_18295, partial [Candidatus Methylomirabilis sp.]|nr:hypothetical protein [Candidatus Methylomirabilis sp.]
MAVALLLLFPARLEAAYTYYYSDLLQSINLSNWQQNGSVTATTGGLTAPGANGGSLITLLANPYGLTQYEVNTVVVLAANGGTYVQYLAASSNAMTGPAATGSFFSVELQNPTVNGSGTVVLNKRENGSFTALTSASVYCHSGMKIRSVLVGANVLVYVEGSLIFNYQFGTLPPSFVGGKPGLGALATPAGNSISSVDLGPKDRYAPDPVNLQSIATSIFPNRVDLEWQGAADDANGTGTFRYSVYRNGTYLGSSLTAEYSDTTVAAVTTYTYALYPVDYHYNFASGSPITITTPPAGMIDPRRVGVRPSGSYWGASGEQIDTQSGNLNYKISLIKPLGRAGRSVQLGLAYNSQLWRNDNGAVWKLGQDVGYGFGWKLLVGALTPYWTNTWVLHHYVFTDSSGAEYRLDINTNGVWTSKEGIYLSYDSNANRIYFNDGSFWAMDCISSGAEQDAGTRYPTLIQDSNGN